jgi:hypothetical protein
MILVECMSSSRPVGTDFVRELEANAAQVCRQVGFE